MMLAMGGQWPPVADGEAAGLVRGGGAMENADDYAFLIRRHVDRAMIEVAIAEGARLGVPAVQVLLSRSWVASTDYVAALTTALAPDATLPSAAATRLIDATAAPPAEIARQVEAARAAGEQPFLVDRAGLELAEPRPQRRRKEHAAATRLLRDTPELSAAQRISTWQLLAIICVPGLVVGGLMVLPLATLIALMAVAAVPFLFVVGLRLVALLVLLAGAKPSAPARPAASGPTADDGALPRYAVLVPLYGEAEVLPGLVEALAGIDYPPEKLDVVLILEESDRDTQAAAAFLELPGYMRVVVVPDGLPRTKPKALNYAALGIASDLIVVYDAEDFPDPDQLRKAAAMFAHAGPRLVCVQARLTICNARASWLSRQFTLEYAALFEGLLPALSRLGLPIPLGGTSNHFRRQALERIGAWDAYNVTEDADLGVRIARAGLRVAVLASDTREEAPARFGVWIRQRTRWQKGFMQTWAVHMRRPLRALRELGPAGFIGVNAIVGGHVVSALLHPFCVGWLTLLAVEGSLFRTPDSKLEAVLLAVALFNFAAGYLSALALAAVAVVRRGESWLIWHLPLAPLYWLLVSAAAWRALWQAARDPYRWEKTPHAPRRAVLRAGLRQ